MQRLADHIGLGVEDGDLVLIWVDTKSVYETCILVVVWGFDVVRFRPCRQINA